MAVCGGARGKWEGMGQPWCMHIHTNEYTRVHTHTYPRTASEAGSSKSYTPLGDARTHTGTDTQEEGAASTALIKTVAAYLSLPLTRGTVREKKHRKYHASQINTVCCWGARGGGSEYVYGEKEVESGP